MTTKKRTRKHAKNSPLTSILVAVTGETSDETAVRFACELLDEQHSKLYILYIIEVEMTLPIDAEISTSTARGEEILDQMEDISKIYKCETQAELLQSRRSGLAIVQESVDKQVDAIVLGIPYQEMYGSFSIGNIAPYILENAPCRVFLEREPIPPKSINNSFTP